MLKVKTTSATLGAIVTGVDLKTPLNLDEWEEIEAAFRLYSVLVFPDQFVNDAQQISFSERFGALERLITEKSDNQAIAPIANVDSKNRVLPEGSKWDLMLKGNTFWHTDSSFKRVPSKASLLSARTLPDCGGETEWADMRAAWETLDHSLKQKVESLVGVHDYRYSQGLVGGTEFLTEKEWEALPPVRHPAVQVHPETGRTALYIGRHLREFEGMTMDESQDLLGNLHDHACQPPRTFLHKWEVGDLVIWDNRCVLHRGYEWDRRQRRIMRRTTVAGDGSNEWAM
jgi:alpha-ketoglutarate-dependent 2,4-dichlorophenoxyacetate dioxygenase